ncbi:zinc finger, CCHC-type containing protein [Tanacetum coccineum]
MGDENPIRTLGDYSKPSHKGYRNTIELPVGNNMVPLRSDTIRLVQNGFSFHGLRSEDPNQQLKDFLKLVGLLDLDGENRERMRLRLFQFSFRDQASNWLERLLAGSITTWEDLTTRFLAQFIPPGRTAKLRNDILMFQQHHEESLSKAWTRFKDLLRKVPHHGLDLWLQNDAFIPVEISLNYENPDIEQLLGIMKRKVDTLMKDAISLMGRSKSIFRMTTNEMYRPPSDPSRQEEFEHIVMNFILDQKERVKQLKEYMKVIVGDFMQLSSEVTRGLKEKHYLDLESPINIMSRLHYNWIMSNRLEPRRKPSNPKKNCNFIGRVKRLRVFFGNFTYKCDFMVLEDTTSVIDHYLGSGVFEKPFKEITASL